MRQLAQSETCTHMCISRATVRKRYSDFEHRMKKSKQCGIAGFFITPSAETSRWQCSNVAADDCGDDVQLASLHPVEHKLSLSPSQMPMAMARVTVRPTATRLGLRRRLRLPALTTTRTVDLLTNDDGRARW